MSKFLLPLLLISFAGAQETAHDFAVREKAERYNRIELLQEDVAMLQAKMDERTVSCDTVRRLYVEAGAYCEEAREVYAEKVDLVIYAFLEDADEQIATFAAERDEACQYTQEEQDKLARMALIYGKEYQTALKKKKELEVEICKLKEEIKGLNGERAVPGMCEPRLPQMRITLYPYPVADVADPDPTYPENFNLCP